MSDARAVTPAPRPRWWRREIPVGTRVARRLLVLFALAMLLPLGGALLLAQDRVQDSLLALHAGRLDELVAHQAAALQARIELADQLAAALVPRHAAALANGAAGQHFARIASVQRDGSLIMLRGRAPARGQEGRLPMARSADERVAVLHDSDGSAHVWLLRPPADPASPARFLMLELDAGWLWNGGARAPAEVDLCVLAADGVPLRCGAALPAAVRTQLGMVRVATPVGRVRWDGPQGPTVSAYRPVRLGPGATAPVWTMVASQPESAALEPVQTLFELVVPALGVAVLVAALLGTLQVNRTLRPLDALTRATRRLAGRDFSTRIDTRGRDEFTELGQAFNGMSDQLQRQFAAMETLSGIDRLILSDPDTASLADFALDRISVAASADLHAVALATDAGDRMMELHWRAAGDSPVRELLDRRALAGRRFDADAGPAGSPAAVVLAADEARALGLSRLASQGAQRLVLQPVMVGAMAEGFIAVGYRDDRQPADDDLKLLHDLADRLAVATASARRDRELRHRALFDPLTGLSNRTHFLDQLATVLATGATDARTAVLFIDLDGFARVNDSQGHAAGDRLLEEAGVRLRDSIDGRGLLGRMGGDEFVVALPGIVQTEEAQTAALRIVAALSEPFEIDGNQHFLAASVGIAIYPDHGRDAEELLRGADLAMYRSKARGRGMCLMFEPSMTVDVQKRTRVEAELRRALDEGQFVLHYQPLVEPGIGRVAGAEALIRWQHPERGMVPPVEFIGIAEQTGLIDEMGEWVLREACRQWVAWKRAGVWIDSVSVNVSVGQFRRSDIIDPEFAAQHVVGMPPQALKLEVTESVMMDDTSDAEQALEELARLGVKLALDDFGTGYSSLAYLRRLPVDTVKLDRSFLRDLGTDEASRELVRSAIAMAHALKKTVTAEGVETEDQLHWLQRWDCDLVQGWYYGKAMPADDFAKFVLARGHAQVAPAA